MTPEQFYSGIFRTEESSKWLASKGATPALKWLRGPTVQQPGRGGDNNVVVVVGQLVDAKEGTPARTHTILHWAQRSTKAAAPDLITELLALWPARPEAQHRPRKRPSLGAQVMRPLGLRK